MSIYIINPSLLHAKTSLLKVLPTHTNILKLELNKLEFISKIKSNKTLKAICLNYLKTYNQNTYIRIIFKTQNIHHGTLWIFKKFVMIDFK